jgi:hypothetical protein
MAEGFNRQVWEASALTQRLNAITGSIFETLSYKIDTKNKEAVNVPVMVSARRAQRKGDTTVTALSKTIIAVPTTNEMYFGVSVPDADIHNTDINIVDLYTKIGMSEIMDGIEIDVTAEMAEGCAADNQMEFTSLDSGATTFTFAGLQAMMIAFDKAKVPYEDRFLRVCPEHKAALINIKDPDTDKKIWIETEANDSAAKALGIVAKIMSFQVQWTNNITKVDTSGVVNRNATTDIPDDDLNTQNLSLFYSRGSVAIGVDEEITVKHAYNAITDGGVDIVNHKQFWGCKVIRSTEIYAIRDNT